MIFATQHLVVQTRYVITASAHAYQNSMVMPILGAVRNVFLIPIVQVIRLAFRESVAIRVLDFAVKMQSAKHYHIFQCVFAFEEWKEMHLYSVTRFEVIYHSFSILRSLY